MYLTPDTRFMVRKAHFGVGDGLYAVHPLEAGAFVIEYQGERLPTASAEEGGSRYLFQIDEQWTVDGPVPENTAGYVNHACMPNCEARIEEDDAGGKRINFYALRDIESGEELTIDYGEEYFKEFIEPVGCRCATCVRGI